MLSELAVANVLRKMMSDLFDQYRPELHYMRDPARGG